MEQLSLLPKVYEYGESLSSEEMNQIVLHLNSSIEAINYLLAKNNGINDGHCEMRYKVSAQLPLAPAAGSDGKSNGWSDTYTKPDTDNGEITWMTLCFLNGDGVYGAWSNPVCITWGSVQGQKGPKGDSGLKGSFKSRVFKRLNSRPDTPTGGTYDNPIPPSGGWTDGIPSGAAIIWSSVCTFYGNGLSSGWSVPAPESDSDTLDIEFSPSAVQPEPPTGNTPFSDHESEGWYDPSSNNFDNVGTMVWRAERKVSNGEYNGEWTITRIVGERGPKGDSGLTGGHYEFRYNNFTPSAQASAPTKPSDGSNGTTGGWTTSQDTLTEQLIKDGTATWMTQCYQNENGIYGNWTDPIRITGANGYDGADGNEIEFVYTRNNTGVTPAAPPTTQQEDWTGTVNGVTWTDNPQGVLENMMYEYVSLRAKINDVWSAYSTPVIWSKWGEKGMDGDGYEYIYKRFSTTITWAGASTASSGSTQGGNDNPANWSTSASGYLNKEYIYSGSGWSDDPVGINETYKYEYVSTREYRLWPNETEKRWGAFSTPTLWSGIPGGKEEFRYANATTAPNKPDAGTSGTTSPWSATQSALTESQIKSGYKTYMTHCFKTDTGTYGTWSDPIRITGANGLDGEDGSDVEFIYKRNNTGSTPSAPTSVNTDDYIPDGWTDNPTGVASNMKYEYVAVREKPAGKNQSWGAYHVALWSKWGEKGMDGDGVLYIYKLFDTELTNQQCIANIPDKPSSKNLYGEWIPSGSDKNAGWSDDPVSPTASQQYCYCSVIKEINGVWGNFEKLSLWSRYAKDSDVPGPDGKGITYIITRDNYTEAKWAAEAVIGDTNNFSRGSSDLGNSCRAGDFFIVKGTATDGTNKFHLATFKCTSFTSDLIYGTCVSHIKDGDKGDPGQSITGKTGPMFYIAGIWDGNTEYTRNDYKCPVVMLSSNNKYYYLKNSSSRGQNPSTSDAWGEADNFAAVFTHVLFSEFAKLGSFVINLDWMLSLHGVEYDSGGGLTMVTGDDTTNYKNFKTSNPTTNLSGLVNFCPNLAIDAKTGKVYAQRMEIGGSSVFKGMVYALGGSFTGAVNATELTAGDSAGMNIRTTQDRIEFRQGDDVRAYFVSDGNGMQLHIWDSGGDEHIINFSNWSSMNSANYTNETWLSSTGNANNPFNSVTLCRASGTTTYLTLPNTGASLVSGSYYKYENAKSVYDTNLVSSNKYPAIFAYYSATINGIPRPYAIDLNVNRYREYVFTDGVPSPTDNYIYHSSDYPNAISFDGYDVQTIHTRNTFLNPKSASSAEFHFRYSSARGTESILTPRGGGNYYYVESINQATKYSTFPEIYEI